jgi:hypothetical protein
MQALFTGGLGDFIGAESFMTEKEKDSVTTLLWATRNRKEIQEAVDLSSVFPNLKDQKILFDDFCDERPTRPWQPGDRFMNIGMKHELNLKCQLGLSNAELDAISDHSLDASLQRIFSGLRWQSSRTVTRGNWPSLNHLKLPDSYVVIHPWSDAEINGREFNQNDWYQIFKFLEKNNISGVVVNKSNQHPPDHKLLIDLTNQTSLKETFSIIRDAKFAILCASSLACLATKMFQKNQIFLKGGHPHMFTEWATYFYHGPFTNPNDLIFRDFSILDRSSRNTVNSMMDLDQGYMSLI